MHWPAAKGSDKNVKVLRSFFLCIGMKVSVFGERKRLQIFFVIIADSLNAPFTAQLTTLFVLAAGMHIDRGYGTLILTSLSMLFR